METMERPSAGGSRAALPQVRASSVSRATKMRVLALFTLGYFVSYLYRGINIGFAPSIMRETGLSAGTYGLVTSMYFLGFAVAQVPAGVLLDRYGPRRVEAALLLVAAVGTLVFGAAHGLPALMLGRLLIGIGVSICLAGAFKAVATLFPAGQLPALYGLVLAGGGFGGVISGAPAVSLLTVADRWTVSLGLALLTGLTAAALFAGTPDAAEPPRRVSFAEQLRGTWLVLTSGFFWRVAPFSVVSQGTFYATQSLWAGAYMEDVSGLDPAGAARFITLIGVAMMAGSVLVGLAARWLSARGLGVVAFSGLCMTVFTLDQIVLIAGLPVPGWLVWTVFGLFGPAGILTYAILTEAFPSEMAGRVNTTLTLLLFVAIFLFQWGIGIVVSLWPAHGSQHAAIGHRVAWGGLVLLQLATSTLYVTRRLRRSVPDAESGKAIGDV